MTLVALHTIVQIARKESNLYTGMDARSLIPLAYKTKVKFRWKFFEKTLSSELGNTVSDIECNHVFIRQMVPNNHSIEHLGQIILLLKSYQSYQWQSHISGITNASNKLLPCPVRALQLYFDWPISKVKFFTDALLSMSRTMQVVM